MTISALMISGPATPMDNAIVDSARNLDSLDKIWGICSVFKTLPFLHKQLLCLLLGEILEDDVSLSGKSDAKDEDKPTAKPGSEHLLSLLCRLQSGSGNGNLSPHHQDAQDAFKEALDELTSQCNSSQADRLHLQQIFELAGLHPAFTAMERAEFADTAVALKAGNDTTDFPLVIPMDSQDIPASPTSSTSPGGSTPNSLSPQNSLYPDGHVRSTSTTRMPHPQPYHPSLHVTYSAPPTDQRRVPWGGKLSLTDGLQQQQHEKVQRSLSSSPSAGENDNGSNGSLSNMAADEVYVHIVPKPGMKDVPLWLKGLRLHKYCTLLAGKSYEELLSVREAQLEAWNVTKGARHKIATCIEKLRQRPDDLCKLAKQLTGVAEVRTVVQELRNLLATPIKMAPAFCMQIGKIHNVEDIPAEDLAARIVVVFRKAANMYLSAMAQEAVEDDCSSLFIQMADRCIRHEAFYGALRSTVISIKQSLQASLRSTGFANQRKVVKSYSVVPLSRLSSPMYSNGQENGAPPSFFISAPPADSFPNRALPQHRVLHRTLAVGKGAPGQSDADLDRLLKPKTALGRTKSAPSPLKPLSATESNMWYDGLDPDLESLTLSVTEHALDSFENV